MILPPSKGYGGQQMAPFESDGIERTRKSSVIITEESESAPINIEIK